MSLNIVFLVTVSLVLASTSADNIEIAGRVLGGSPTDPSLCPWQVLIASQTRVGWVYSSGSLLNNSWIITQAEPLRGAVRSIVTLGSGQFFKFDEDNAEIATAYPEDYVFHPQSQPRDSRHNLALIKLNWQLRRRSNTIRPVSPLTVASTDPGRQLQGAQCRVCGFGAHSRFLYSNGVVVF